MCFVIELSNSERSYYTLSITRCRLFHFLPKKILSNNFAIKNIKSLKIFCLYVIGTFRLTFFLNFEFQLHPWKFISKLPIWTLFHMQFCQMSNWHYKSGKLRMSAASIWSGSVQRKKQKKVCSKNKLKWIRVLLVCIDYGHHINNSSMGNSFFWFPVNFDRLSGLFHCLFHVTILGFQEL